MPSQQMCTTSTTTSENAGAASPFTRLSLLTRMLPYQRVLRRIRRKPLKQSRRKVPQRCPQNLLETIYLPHLESITNTDTKCTWMMCKEEATASKHIRVPPYGLGPDFIHSEWLSVTGMFWKELTLDSLRAFVQTVWIVSAGFLQTVMIVE